MSIQEKLDLLSEVKSLRRDDLVPYDYFLTLVKDYLSEKDLKRVTKEVPKDGMVKVCNSASYTVGKSTTYSIMFKIIVAYAEHYITLKFSTD